MFDLITIGDSTFDTFLILEEKNNACSLSKNKKLLCFNYADKTPIENTAQSVGGNAANVAVAVRKLGFRTSIVTELGDDINGHIIKEQLAEMKVDTSMVKKLKNNTTRYSIVLNYCGERTILSYYAKRNYTLPILPKTKWIYYTSLGKSFEKIQDKLIKHLQKNPEIKLAINPGSYQINMGLEKIKQILPFTDLLIVNKEEAEKLTGKKQSHKQLLSALHKAGAKMIVLTDNENGSYAFDGEYSYFMPIYKVNMIAMTGAGDAYTSGFLGAIFSGKHFTEAMVWGTANASSVIQEFGSQQGLLNKKQLDKIMKENKSIQAKII
ncbi:MAG: carbohydrate kinase family protein [Patescibacteria group bacterium]|nr:carbohydrate kinase family protein [Patescibacteria group bacterium]